jgi:hypothetical protein
VTSKKIKNSSITQQDLAFLLPVPSPAADIFSGYRDGPVMVAGDQTIASLKLPANPGYAVVAKAWGENSDANHPTNVRCVLSAGNDTDTVQVLLARRYDAASVEGLNFTLVHKLTGSQPLTLSLRCNSFGVSTIFRDIKMTAITAVGQLQNVPIN